MNRVPFKRARIEAEHAEMGLVSMMNGKLGWGWKQGRLLWLPYPVRKFIVVAWNHIACTIIGHSHLCRRAPGELPVCCDCSRRVRPKPEQESSVINEW